MTNNKHKGKELNFWQLINSSRIEIPIIQRDYAQGRKEKKELRLNFLNALANALIEKKEIKLDFIYGEISNGAFNPLDGQQRLTTLFLIYWYAALKDNKLNKENIQILQKFSYETRASSREFCKALVGSNLKIESSKTLSEQIINSSWFFLAWKKDPTISAMLQTIDSISYIFSDINDLWNLLTNDSNNLINFYHVVLEDIGLTDDLYIKMNARGKLLTSFENFKASFQKKIYEEKWEDGLELTNSFAYKIDTVWADLFWKHRINEKIDYSITRLISSIAMFQHVISKSENRLDKISSLQRNPHLVRIEDFSRDGYGMLFNYLEIYSKLNNNKIIVKPNFPLWQHAPKDDLFSALVYDDIVASYTTKVLFFAQTEYLRINPDFDNESYTTWMRFIRNIISRGDVTKNGDRPTIIRSPETFEGVINLINEIAIGSNDIYNYIVSNQLKSTFAREQIEEERLKAKLIIENSANKEVIYSLEDTNFFRGKINFALYCIDYSSTEDNFDKEKLNDVLLVIQKYFEEDISDDIRRGLLTICDDEGNYNYYNYWWSWSYLVNANKRCLISKYRELEYYIYGNYPDKEKSRLYLKKLIHKLIVSDIGKIVSDFIPPEGMPNWKVRLIKEADLLNNKCHSKYIAIPVNEEYCYLLRGVRPRDLTGCKKVV